MMSWNWLEVLTMVWLGNCTSKESWSIEIYFFTWAKLVLRSVLLYDEEERLPGIDNVVEKREEFIDRVDNNAHLACFHLPNELGEPVIVAGVIEELAIVNKFALDTLFIRHESGNR
jgi:hypothetical protein